ncbi:hypothetical protein G4228_012193 [Cervus hanglu yarkandensis]|nr:hypothetical protein G4228_012193 [Cervus hanglu yarkandensis]
MSGSRAPGPEAGASGAEPPGAALSVDVAGLLAQLARSFALLLPVYALGYLGLSFSWVLLALGLLVWCRRSRGLKATRLCRALALLEDEERAVRLGVRACDLPAWIHGTMRVILEPLIGDMPLVGALSIFFLRKPGVLRIHFIEAQDLQGKDTYLKGLVKGKSDPYGVIRVGNQIFQSKVIKENLSPKWNEVYEALVYEHPGQELEIELFDEDPDKDDFLGSLMIDLIEVEKERLLDEWFALDEVPRGKLHLKLEWLTLMPDASNLEQVLTDIRADKDQANDGLSSSLLILYLDSARNLPIRYKTNEPVWEENFTFFIHNPKRQELEVEVRDEQHQCSLGNLRIPLSQLLAREDMTLNQRFQLSNSGPNSSLKMKLALRVCFHPKVLHLEKQERPPDHQHSAQVKRPSVSKEGRKVSVRPQMSASPGSGDSGTAPSTPVAGSSERPGVEERGLPAEAGLQGPRDLGRSSSSLQAGPAGSPSHVSVKEPTPSIASDISLPIATQELRQRLRQLENGTTLGQSPLGQIQLTIRHSSQRNKLVVVVHSCSFDFSVSLPDVQRRTLDVAVKNSGGFLSKDKGLLGKVLVGLASEELAKGWTQW